MMKKALILTALLLGLAGSAAAQVVIQSMFGDVSVQKSSSSEWKKAEARMTLASGDSIRTAGHSGAMLYVNNEENILSLSADSKLMVTETMAEKKKKSSGFVLFVGMLKSRLKKMPDEEMDFSGPTAVVGVRGTEFLIAVAEDGTSKVAVTRGVVDVQGEHNSVSLASNESSTVALAGEPQDKVLFQGEDDEITKWKITTSSRLKGNEAAILDQCARGLEFNYAAIDGLIKAKTDTESRITVLKEERGKLEAAGDTAGSAAKGQEASLLVAEVTRNLVNQINLDRRDQAIMEIALRCRNSAPADKDLKAKLAEIQKRYDVYHGKFVSKKKKGCL